jgi:hypothetical protein
MDAMDFFQKSAGTWRSQRTTHHLPFRRAEVGESEIQVDSLSADDPKVAEVCRMHEIDPSRAAGGARVSWEGSMEWDKEDEENHSGSTVLVLVPNEDDASKGLLLRERGYAEVAPVAGKYEIDSEDAMLLITDYETMSSVERFWFPNDDLRMRSSTMTRFGGFSTASFCTELRVDSAAQADNESENSMPPAGFSALGW